MKNEVMICGRDCHPGGANCNNYCNHDKSKPMADHPPAATHEMVIARAKDRAAKAIAEAEKACAEFAEAAKMQPQADNVTLRECLEVLQYATYHDGRYGQVHNYEKFQGPAQRLVKRIADRLGVEPYEGFVA